MTHYLAIAAAAVATIALVVAIVCAIDISSDRKKNIRADQLNARNHRDLAYRVYQTERAVRMLAATHPDPVTQRLVSQRQWEQTPIGDRPQLRAAMGQTRPVPNAQD